MRQTNTEELFGTQRIGRRLAFAVCARDPKMAGRGAVRRKIIIFFEKSDIGCNQTEILLSLRVRAKNAPPRSAVCRRMACGILENEADADEVLNEAYFALWNAIPPAKPGSLFAYLARTVRNLCLNRRKAQRAKRRGGDSFSVVLSELEECAPAEDFLPHTNSAEDAHFAAQLGEVLNAFLHAQGKTEQVVFVCRYFYGESVAEIAARQGCGQERVKSMLHRMRKKLRRCLEEEGYSYEA